VYCCLLVFSILLSLRVDELITWNYAVVFIPIWVWNSVLLVSGLLGIGCWIKRKDARYVWYTFTLTSLPEFFPVRVYNKIYT